MMPPVALPLEVGATAIWSSEQQATSMDCFTLLSTLILARRIFEPPGVFSTASEIQPSPEPLRNAWPTLPIFSTASITSMNSAVCTSKLSPTPIAPSGWLALSIAQAN